MHLKDQLAIEFAQTWNDRQQPALDFGLFVDRIEKDYFYASCKSVICFMSETNKMVTVDFEEVFLL